MDCEEDCEYDNLSLSRVMARVFSLKSTPFNMWVMWVYIVWVETWCIRYDWQNRMFREYLAGRSYHPRHSRKPTVTICHDSSHNFVQLCIIC